MPRNVAKPVSAHDAYHARKVADVLTPINREVTLTYVKRNGERSSSTGKVGAFSGIEGMDTHSVTLDTADKGPRTINLHRVVMVA